MNIIRSILPKGGPMPITILLPPGCKLIPINVRNPDESECLEEKSIEMPVTTQIQETKLINTEMSVVTKMEIIEQEPEPYTKLTNAKKYEKKTRVKRSEPNTFNVTLTEADRKEIVGNAMKLKAWYIIIIIEINFEKYISLKKRDDVVSKGSFPANQRTNLF